MGTRSRAACSEYSELTRFPDFGKTENYGRRGSCRSRARRCRSRLVREGETKSQYVTAIESSSAATPSSNCQPVPTRTFFEIPALRMPAALFATGEPRCYSLSRRQASAAAARDRAPAAARA